MCLLRNIEGIYHKADKKLVQGKKRWVFQQILALQRMYNPCALNWGSLCQAITFYGWGVGRMALDACTYWCKACLSLTHDRTLYDLTKYLSKRQAAYFSQNKTKTFVLDNVQRDGKLKNPYGSRKMHFLPELSSWRTKFVCSRMKLLTNFTLR